MQNTNLTKEIIVTENTGTITPEHGPAHNFQRTAKWLAACGKLAGNDEHLSTQIGVHMEEMSEFLRTIYIESNTGLTSMALQEIAAILDAVGANVKAGNAKAIIHDREAALDALCDCEVTGNGVAFLAAMDKPEGDRRTLNSNDSKFNADGTPVILDGGKVGKSPLWQPAVYEDLV